MKAKHSNFCVNFWHNLGRLLLVGEGNFSFARSLLKNGFVGPEDLVCTTIENEHELSSEATLNVLSICHSGGEVGVRVDGRILEKSFRPQTFDSVGFQFPHACTRESKFRRTENHVLIRRFLRSASNIVSPQGILFITFVDSEFYRGQFALDEAARFAKVEKRMELPFTPSLFAGYRHENTLDTGSAVAEKATFTTAVFCR